MTTRLMVKHQLTREQARELVLVRLRDFDKVEKLDTLEPKLADLDTEVAQLQASIGVTPYTR